MNQDKQDQLTRYGFRMGRSGAHASRTMMLDELQTLLDAAPPNASKSDYLSLVVDANLLGKGTAKAKQLTAKHLAELYGLDDSFACSGSSATFGSRMPRPGPFWR